MTIHKRRGSGYWYYWIFFGFGALGVLVLIAAAAGGGLEFSAWRGAMSIAAVLAVLAVARAVTRRRT